MGGAVKFGVNVKVNGSGEVVEVAGRPVALLLPALSSFAQTLLPRVKS